ncbi:MAG: hypothetical protein ACKO04_01715 [Actinomycetes bacterium]
MWAGAQDAARLVLFADDEPVGPPAVLARLATYFSFPVEVRTVTGTTSAPTVPAPLPMVLPADAAPEAAAAMAVEGLEVVVEQGVVRGELLGLEVARVVPWPVEHGGDGTLHLEAGVGRFDRDAVAEVHPDEAPEVSLARTVAMVRAERYPGAAGHPMARMARDRWLRVAVCDDPTLVGAAELHPVESTVERSSVRDLSPAPALGTAADGAPVVVVCTAGVDLSLVPVAADVRALHAPRARLVLAAPERDLLPSVARLAGLLVEPAEVVGVPAPWGAA